MNLSLLKKAYPYAGNFTASVKTIAFISTFIMLFVFFFRTGNFTEASNYAMRLFISISYGLITFGVASVNASVVGLFVNHEAEKNWKVWHEIILYIWHFLSISIAIYLLTPIILQLDEPFSILDFFKSVGTTVIIGAIPVSLHVINEEKKRYKENYALASKLNPNLDHRKPVDEDSTLTINTETISVPSILFAESNRNYVNVTLTDKRVLSIRITIKELEEKISAFPQLVRCHRAFIINANKITNVQGNAQGLKLFIENYPSFVPVSRSYIPKVDHVICPN